MKHSVQILILGLATLVGQTAFAIPQVRPAFDVATIKPVAPDDRTGRYIVMQGGHQFVAKAYSLKRMVCLALDGITSFSVTPLRLITLLGSFICILTLLYAAYVLTLVLGLRKDIPGA